jgi:O-antigen/teichoic acid export membrane protein
MFVKLNLLLLIPMLALSVLFEPILLRLVSGQEALVAGGLLPLLTLVLILQAIKTCTAMAVAALEDGRTQLTTSLVNAVIFGVGVWAAGRQRLELLIGALLVGELVSFCVMSMSLRRNGVSAWKFTPSALMLAAPLAVICVLTVSLTAVSAIQRVWVLGSYIGLGAAVVLLLLRRSYFDEAEVAWFAGLLPDRLRRRFKGLH